MAVTRIKNNQITDQTIEYTKIKPATLVGSLFNPNVTIASNIIIQGNLSVSGTTSTVNSVDTLINDPLVIFNNGYVGTPSYDVGMLINRNLNPINAAWVWREANVGFAGVLTSETGTTTGSVNNTTYANLIIGNTIIDAYSVNSVTAGTGAFQVRGGAGISANLNVGGSSTVLGVGTGVVRIDGNAPITQITSLTSTRYGLMLTDTNNNGAFAFRTGTAKGAEIHTFGGTNNDIYIQPDRLKSIWLPAANAAVLIDNNINSSATSNVAALNITGSGGIYVGGNINTGTAVSVESQHITFQSSKQNDIAIGKNTLKSGLSANVTIIGTMVGTTSVGTNATIYGAAAGPAAIPANATYLGKSAGNAATGSDSVYIGYNSGSLVTTGQYNVILGSYDGNVIASQNNQVVIADGQGAPRVRIDATGNTFVVSGVNSTTANTGAFVVQGGAGIGGNLNVGGAVGLASKRLVIDATQTSIVMGANTATTFMSTDSVFIGQKIGSSTNFGAKTTIVGSEAAATNTNGAEITLFGYRTGYAGAGQNTTAIGSQAGLNLQSTALQNQLFGYLAGSQITTGDYNVVLGANTMTGLETVNNYIVISDGQGAARLSFDGSGVGTLYNTTASTSQTNGALIVYGGIGVGRDSFFGGNVTVQANLFVLGNVVSLDSETLTTKDSTLLMHYFANLTPLGANDSRDIGVVSNYYITTPQKAFFGWQNSTSNFVYMDKITESSGNVISGTYGNVQFGSLWLSNTTASGSQTTGTLVVKGGIGTGALSYLHSATVDNNLTASGAGALVTFSPTGAGYVTINPQTRGTMDNMDIGQTTPQIGSFKDISITTGTTPAGRNATFSGNGYVYIQPTGTVTIAPTATGNMDNVFIGNTTPRQATFTSANVNADFKLTSFSGNSVMFIDTGTASVVSNLAITQHQAAFNYQRGTANTFSTVALSIGHSSQDNLLKQGTDTLNIRYQGDSFVLNSDVAANTVSQAMGWTTSTARGTTTAPAVTQDGDFNGVYGAYAWTGSTPSYQEISSLRYVNQGTTGAASGIGGQAQIWTKRDNGASTLALRVDANQIATFTGQVAIANTTTSTNTTTGALYVAGGVSAGGNLNVAQGARINDTQNSNRDFIVRGPNDATLIWANTAPGYNTVLIGNSAIGANVVVGAKLQVFSTDSFLMPVGDTGQRPDVPSSGMLRFNSLAADIEFWDGSQWYQPKSGSGYTIVTDDQFNGDGNTTEFLMTRAGTTNGTFVTLNGVLQHPSVAYNTFTANSKIVFTEAPAVGDAIDVRAVTLTTEIIGLSSPNGFVTLATENSGVTIKTGEQAANVSIHVHQNSGALEYTPGNVQVGTSPAVIDVFDKISFRSAKYVVNVQSGSNFEVSEVMVLHDGTTAYRTQYNKIYNASSLGSVTASVTGANVYVYYTGIAATNYVKTTASHYG
jgi:hypothetical protein